jgi:hypothetical protein
MGCDKLSTQFFVACVALDEATNTAVSPTGVATVRFVDIRPSTARCQRLGRGIPLGISLLWRASSRDMAIVRLLPSIRWVERPLLVD